MTISIRTFRICSVVIVPLSLFWPSHGLSQNTVKPTDSNAVMVVGCPQGVDFESYNGTNDPYTVTSVDITNPFNFLPWIKSRDVALAEDISRLVKQKPFTRALTVDKAFEMIEAADLLPGATHVRLKALIIVVVVSCQGSSRNINISYQIYTSQIAPAASGTAEGQKEVEETPQNIAGLTLTTNRAFLPSTLIPRVAFDSTDKLSAGGSVTFPVCSTRPCKLPLQLVISGQGSQAMHTFHSALQLSVDSVGPILHSNYLLSYDLSSTPTGAGQLRRAVGSLQYSGTGRAFLAGNVNARFGMLLEKGDEQSYLRVPLPAGAPTASAVGALKLYAGLDSRFSHSVLSSSFGFELGSTDVTSGIQWRKYIGDVHDDFWHTLGKHTIAVDSRLSVGSLQAVGRTPISERFFGGNYEQWFMPDDSWQIRSNPVIRAISGRRFFNTSAGAGGDSFVAANFTAAYSVWQEPLVPYEVRNDTDFKRILDAQIGTATSLDQLHYVTNDPSYKAIVSNLPAIAEVLKELSQEVSDTQRKHPDEFATQFKSCSSALRVATSRTKSALAASDSKQYGLVSALLRVDPTEDRLSRTIATCGDLNSHLKDLTSVNVTPLIKEQILIENAFISIDHNQAQKKAKSDMAFVSRTIHTLFNEVNLASVGPVAIVDFAHIGPTGSGVNGTRYGPGGGLRLELASAVSFTVAYARNVIGNSGEGSGALVFSITMRDLFH